MGTIPYSSLRSSFNKCCVIQDSFFRKCLWLRLNQRLGKSYGNHMHVYFQSTTGPWSKMNSTNRSEGYKPAGINVTDGCQGLLLCLIPHPHCTRTSYGKPFTHWFERSWELTCSCGEAPRKLELPENPCACHLPRSAIHSQFCDMKEGGNLIPNPGSTTDCLCDLVWVN